MARRAVLTSLTLSVQKGTRMSNLGEMFFGVCDKHPRYKRGHLVTRWQAFHDAVLHARTRGDHAIRVGGRSYSDQSIDAIETETLQERAFLQHLRDPIRLTSGSKVLEEDEREKLASIDRLDQIRAELARRGHTAREGYEPTTDPLQRRSW